MEVNNISKDDTTFINITSTPNYALDGLRLSMYVMCVIDISSTAFVTKLIKTLFHRKFSLLRAMGHCKSVSFGSFASMRNILLWCITTFNTDTPNLLLRVFINL